MQKRENFWQGSLAQGVRQLYIQSVSAYYFTCFGVKRGGSFAVFRSLCHKIHPSPNLFLYMYKKIVFSRKLCLTNRKTWYIIDCIKKGSVLHKIKNLHNYIKGCPK